MAYRILVVEDEEILLKLFKRTLEEEGFEVISASDGLTALELIQSPELKIDMLIADIVLPKVSGIRLGYELSRRSSETKVLLISGYTHFDQDENGFPILHKPFEVSEFLKRVRSALQSE